MTRWLFVALILVLVVVVIALVNLREMRRRRARRRRIEERLARVMRETSYRSTAPNYPISVRYAGTSPDQGSDGGVGWGNAGAGGGGGDGGACGGD